MLSEDAESSPRSELFIDRVEVHAHDTRFILHHSHPTETLTLKALPRDDAPLIALGRICAILDGLDGLCQWNQRSRDQPDGVLSLKAQAWPSLTWPSVGRLRRQLPAKPYPLRMGMSARARPPPRALWRRRRALVGQHA